MNSRHPLLTLMNIPTELTEFVPEKVTFGTSAPFPSWELKASEFSDSVEIRNVIFSRTAIISIIVIVAWIMLIGGIIIAAIIMNDMPGNIPKALLIVFACLACLAGTGIIIAVLLYEVSSNASLWKEGLRFRYDKTSSELFFPRENVRYSGNNYDTLILGLTDGYDAIKIAEDVEAGERDGQMDFITQAYFLVRRKDGTWSRHLIVYDLYSKSVHRSVAKVQRTMRCPLAKRRMTLPECYATQHVPAAEAERTAPPKTRNMLIVYCFCSLLMAVGLGVAGFGLHGLWHINDDAFNAIIFGTVFFLFPLVFMLVWRHVTKSNDLSAPYTPSEAVLSEWEQAG